MGSKNTLRWIWMHFTPRSASSSSLDAYVGGSQSLRYAKTSFPKVCIPSSHPYLALVLISTPQCITGLRSKRSCANPATITVTLTECKLQLVSDSVRQSCSTWPWPGSRVGTKLETYSRDPCVRNRPIEKSITLRTHGTTFAPQFFLNLSLSTYL